MFVSSYSTYIQTNTSDKVAKDRVGGTDGKSKSFSSKLVQNVHSGVVESSDLPVNYISKNLVLKNKQLLQNQKKYLDEPENSTKELTNKFSLQNSLINAKDAYEKNSIMFSLFQKPHATLNQTPKLEDTLPREPSDIKELNMRHKMVNTYIANDNYYKITA